MRFVPRAENQEADDRSKDEDVAAYCIAPKAVAELCKRWKFTVSFDLFSSAWARVSHKARFCSRWFAPGSQGDAFGRSWSPEGVGSGAWIHPPPAILETVIRKIIKDGTVGVLVTPAFSDSAWAGWLNKGRRRGGWVKASSRKWWAHEDDITRSTAPGGHDGVPSFALRGHLIDCSTISNEGGQWV